MPSGLPLIKARLVMLHAAAIGRSSAKGRAPETPEQMLQIVTELMEAEIASWPVHAKRELLRGIDRNSWPSSEVISKLPTEEPNE